MKIKDTPKSTWTIVANKTRSKKEDIRIEIYKKTSRMTFNRCLSEYLNLDKYQFIRLYIDEPEKRIFFMFETIRKRNCFKLTQCTLKGKRRECMFLVLIP